MSMICQILCLYRKRLHHSFQRHRAGDVQGSSSYLGRAGETSERAEHHRHRICLSQNHCLLCPRLVRDHRCVPSQTHCLCQELLFLFLALFCCTDFFGFMMFYENLLISGTCWCGLLSSRLSCLLAQSSDYNSGARLVSKNCFV